MPDLPDHAQKMIDEFKNDALVHMNEASRAVGMMNMIEQKYGLPPTILIDLAARFSRSKDADEGGVLQDEPGVSPTGAGRTTRVRPDQYLGQAPLEAAKAYLSQIGHATPFDGIAAGVQRGGAAIKGADWREKLAMSLIRSVHDVVKVSDGVFGLKRFYTDDQIRGLRATRRQPTKPAKRKRGRPKVSAKTKAAPKAPRTAKRTGSASGASAPKSARATNGSGEPMEARAG